MAWAHPASQEGRGEGAGHQGLYRLGGASCSSGAVRSRELHGAEENVAKTDGLGEFAGAVQLPPPGFPPNPHDVVPAPFAWTAPSGAVVQLWLHDVVADPQESVNLAATRPAVLQQMIAAYEEYQKGAVPDLADVRGCGAGGAANCDPAANPALRPDKTWGPFTDSTKCRWL